MSTESSIFTQSEIRTIIKFLTLQKKNASVIHQELVDVMGQDAPSYRTVADWSSRFKAGRISIADDPRSGRPQEASSSGMISAVQKMVEENGRVTYDEMQHSLGIGRSTIQSLLHDHLNLKKLCGRWIPHMLTIEQKEKRVSLSRQMLNKFRRWGVEGMRNVVSGDETYVMYYDPLTSSEQRSWRHSTDPPSTTCKSSFQEKVLYTVFIAQWGVVVKMPLPKGGTVSGGYYANTVLPHVLKVFQERRPGQPMKLHDDNAPAHRSAKVLEFLDQQRITKLEHPPYSPDLAPLDFFVFPRLKKALRGRSFSNRQHIGQAISEVLEAFTEDDWLSCFQQWKSRLQQCIDAGGEYFEHLK
jgi:[histone H3]-lysine36 N-dimethyltransferase SETMAR